MRKAIATLVVLAACSSAKAEDLLSPNLTRPLDEIAYRWSGFYVGVNSGFVWGKSTWTAPGASTGRFDLTGFSVGGTIGYNYQIDRAVVGIEGDLAWANTRGSTTVNCPLGCETKNNWRSTVRGRFGFGGDRFMPFVSAGFAFADVKASSPGQQGLNTVATGWAAGIGVEYVLTENWTAKAEYIYLDFGSLNCGPNCGIGTPVNVSLADNQLRLGITYRFPVQAPLVQIADLGPRKPKPCGPHDPTDPGPHCDTAVAKKEHKKRSEQQRLVNSSVKQ